ncbi:MAG: hypothetical protein AB8F26_11875 [Phycisphaerales bacterium]
MSSFKSLDLFGSGPHRFTVGREGRRVVSLAAVAGDPSLAGTFSSGDQELRITVRGRLVADSESDLWDLRDDIVAEAGSTASAGTLADGNGQSWTGLKLIEFEPGGPTDRGRVFSLGYNAEFGRITGD